MEPEHVEQITDAFLDGYDRQKRAALDDLPDLESDEYREALAIVDGE